MYAFLILVVDFHEYSISTLVLIPLAWLRWEVYFSATTREPH